jgi:hypothetical protein
MIAVPFFNVLPLLKCLTICPRSKTKSSVDASCRNCPLTQVLTLSICGSPNASLDAITGPNGANLSKDFA